MDFAFFLASIGELDDEDDELDDTEPESTAVTAVDIDELLEVMRMDDDDDREEQEEPEEPALVLLGQDVVSVPLLDSERDLTHSAPSASCVSSNFYKRSPSRAPAR